MSLLLASLVALGAAATIGGALFFQHVLGYQPCPLCLLQRWPYYVGLPVALGFIAVLQLTPSRGMAMGGFALLAIIFAVSMGMGVHHAGVEWKLWAGPSTCGEGVAAAQANLLEALQNTRIVPCDTAAWRFLGISMAGWNAIVSQGLSLTSAYGFWRAKSGI